MFFASSARVSVFLHVCTQMSFSRAMYVGTDTHCLVVDCLAPLLPVPEQPVKFRHFGLRDGFDRFHIAPRSEIA